MTANRIGKVLLLAVIETVLFLAVFFIVIFGFSYFQANLFLFTDFSVLSHSAGWDKFLMFIYLGCNALFMIFITLVVIELVLFLLRVMVKTILNTFRYLSLRTTDKADHIVKQISLITIFKKLKINTPKRAVITYIVLIVLLFGVKFVAQQIMKGSDTFVYRVYENLHLNTETQNYEFADAIAAGDEYTLNVFTSVGNIHLYQMKNQTTANFVYLYDTSLQLLHYDYTIDEVNKTITIDFNEGLLSYLEYSDVLRPQVEIYLPEGLILSEVNLTVSVSGDVVVDYTGMDSLTIVAQDSEIYVSAISSVIDNLSISAISSKLRIQTNSLNQAYFNLDDSEATLTLGDVYNQLEIVTSNNSNLYLYNLDVTDLNISSSDSFLELREVYGTTITVHLVNDTYEHLNGSVTKQPDSYFIYQTNSSVELRGVESDS